MKRLLKKGQALENQLVTPAPKETRRNRKNSEKGEKGEEKKGEEKDNVPKKGWSEGSLGKPISSSGNFFSVISYGNIKTMQYIFYWFE